ncbi:MAG: right-handed parallel beta-helix repeat-containing protein, partial [Bacteroidales bacterium]|nr:right-handed parallel beta-helix repeat-containing protein [Bacteroidales bacterium]
ADGDASNHIAFTSNQAIAAPGDWKFFYIYYPDGPCLFDYCDILYGGALHNGNSYGSVYLQGSYGYVNFSNLSISNSLSQGVRIFQDASPSFINCSISNNGGYGIYLNSNASVTFGSGLAEWNDIHDNTNYNIYNATSGDIHAPYIYWGTLDESQIATGIYDHYDNGSYGIVHFSPYTDAGHSSLYGYHLDIHAFLEGPFNGTGMNTNLNFNGSIPLSQPYNQTPWSYMGAESVAAIPNADIVDWVLVELRDAPDAASAGSTAIVARQAAFLLKDGSVVAIDGTSVLSFNHNVVNSLFVVIWHRNHLGIMSANPLIESMGIFSYDFSSGAGQVFGGSIAHKEIASGIWGLAGADGNADGQVNNGDKNDIWSPQAGTGGYLQGDFNLDAEVNNGDKNDVWIPNTGLGGQVPQ